VLLLAVAEHLHLGRPDLPLLPYKVTGKRVSVWSTDKRSQELERMGPASRERTIEVLKAEASPPVHLGDG